MQKKGIALLITLLFVIAITLSIGIGLKQVKSASIQVQNESFMLQTSMILDDVLRLLQTSKELDGISGDSKVEILNVFLSQSSFIPLEASDIKISLEIFSARGKLNINALVDSNTTNTTATTQRLDSLKDYLSNYNINSEYSNILLDLMGGIKEDMSYNSDIFNEKPYLFRDYVSSDAHLDEVKDFYMKTYHDNSLKNVNFKNLFYFNKDKTTKIDLNYATPEVWELILGVDKPRAEDLSSGGGAYATLEDIELSDDEKYMLSRFEVSYFEPHLDINIEIIQNSNMAKIHFEYDITQKKGSNFSYEI